MKISLKYFLILTAFLFAAACDRSFLKEEKDTYGLRTVIFISPEWQATDYPIFCQGVNNAKFKVEDAPQWLSIYPKSGQFTDSYTTVNLKANTYDKFSEVGIYQSFITLSVEGSGNWMIPITYITEGNPKIEVGNSFTINYYSNWGDQLPVKNNGEGILICVISEYSEWLEPYITGINEENPQNLSILPPHTQDAINMSYNYTVPLENPVGKIVIESNDKHNPRVEVEVKIIFGNPVFSVWNSNTMDFGQQATTRNFSFSNSGNGMLVWKIENCPEWLTVSEPGGILDNNKHTTITFSCNRELLSPGINTATIYIKTNDKNNLFFPITVTAINNTTE